MIKVGQFKLMALQYLSTSFLILLILPCVFSKVYWRLSSLPAIFGQDTVLTCHLDEIFTHPKDCTVRQWSGGPERRGLVYNGYSSDSNKYEEYTNMGSFEFSLIIKHLTESDIDVNYTCSCGFNTSTKNLSLDANSFHYPPAGINHTFSIEHDLLGVLLTFRKVFPVPNCSLYLGDSLITTKVPVTHKSNGLVYSVRYNASYTLKEKDCNKLPELKCTFNHVAEAVIFKGHETYHCLVNKITIVVASAVVFYIVITVFVCILKHKECYQSKRKRSMKKETNDSRETDHFITFKK
ncbi:unnamed protein product [Mytilus coruscus]|uniref:Ig-like domain-containing protein n=1 Tax=Mytilus coruscus TaxID=42192 RepID=A0A6J8EPS9_MYTCO|nr:unnamed protein product [Mytilus coruscus]